MVRLHCDGRTGDPLYKHWPFLLVRGAAAGRCHGVLYDSMAPATFDLGCEHSNYYGRRAPVMPAPCSSRARLACHARGSGEQKKEQLRPFACAGACLHTLLNLHVTLMPA